MPPSQSLFSLCRSRSANPATNLRCAAQNDVLNSILLRFKSTAPPKTKFIPSRQIKPAPRKTTPATGPTQAGQPWRPTLRPVTPEKLLIYHGGTGRGVFLGMLRGATIFVCGVSTLIIAPAFFADEFPAYLAPLIVIGGALPLAFVAYTTAPFVNHIYLHLPAFARKSRETALDYARNLPSTAMVSIRTMKITLIPRVTEVHVSNLVPDKALLRPVSFRNRDPVSVPWWRGGTLKQFYAMEKSRDTRSTSKFYPELWEHVHKQIYSQRPGPQQ